MSSTQVGDRMPCLQVNASESHYSVYLMESMTPALIPKQLIKFAYNLFLLILFMALGAVMVSIFCNCAHGKKWTDAIYSELHWLERHDKWYILSSSNNSNDNLWTTSLLMNNMLLMGTKAGVRWMKSVISKRFKIKDLGNVKFFLSMRVELDHDKRMIYRSQVGRFISNPSTVHWAVVKRILRY